MARSSLPSRAGWVTLAAWLLRAGLAQAEMLGEAEVVRSVRLQDPSILAAQAAVSVTQAKQLAADLYPNPQLSWAREAFPSGDPRESEDTLAVSVPVELSGRRSAQRALARAEAVNAEADAVRLQSAALHHSLELFYASLAAKRNAEIASQSVERLDEAVRVLARRRSEGTASGYDEHRLQVEAELARSESREASARARAIQNGLAVLLGLESKSITLKGELRLVDSGAVSVSEREDQANRPSAARGSRRSIELDRRAVAETREASDSAESAWVPDIELMGGLRIGHAGETRYGYVAGLAVSLPLFSRGQELRAEAEARHQLGQARVRVAERQARIATQSATDAMELAEDELRRFEMAIRDTVTRLERAAQSGYTEGERSILELLDVQKTRVAVEKRRLELEFAARRAELQLRAARGDFER